MRGARAFGNRGRSNWIMRQVACLSDGDAHLALEAGNPFAIQTKPHGHGDVHALLHTTGLLKRWVGAGVRWVAFFQDTNALVFRGLPAALGQPCTLPPTPCDSLGACQNCQAFEGRCVNPLHFMAILASLHCVNQHCYARESWTHFLAGPFH